MITISKYIVLLLSLCLAPSEAITVPSVAWKIASAAPFHVLMSMGAAQSSIANNINEWYWTKAKQGATAKPCAMAIALGIISGGMNVLLSIYYWNNLQATFPIATAVRSYVALNGPPGLIIQSLAPVFAAVIVLQFPETGSTVCPQQQQDQYAVTHWAAMSAGLFYLYGSRSCSARISGAIALFSLCVVTARKTKQIKQNPIDNNSP